MGQTQADEFMQRPAVLNCYPSNDGYTYCILRPTFHSQVTYKDSCS